MSPQDVWSADIRMFKKGVWGVCFAWQIRGCYAQKMLSGVTVLHTHTKFRFAMFATYGVLKEIQPFRHSKNDANTRGQQQQRWPFNGPSWLNGSNQLFDPPRQSRFEAGGQHMSQFGEDEYIFKHFFHGLVGGSYLEVSTENISAYMFRHAICSAFVVPVLCCSIDWPRPNLTYHAC